MKKFAALVALFALTLFAPPATAQQPKDIGWSFGQRLTDLERRVAVLEKATTSVVSSAAKTTADCACGATCPCAQAAPQTVVTASGRVIRMTAGGSFEYADSQPAHAAAPVRYATTFAAPPPFQYAPTTRYATATPVIVRGASSCANGACGPNTNAGFTWRSP